MVVVPMFWKRWRKSRISLMSDVRCSIESRLVRVNPPVRLVFDFATHEYAQLDDLRGSSPPLEGDFSLNS
jgi:hypothetical protein